MKKSKKNQMPYIPIAKARDFTALSVKELDKYELIEILDKLCDEYRVRSLQSDWPYQQVGQFQKQAKQLILENVK